MYAHTIRWRTRKVGNLTDHGVSKMIWVDWHASIMLGFQWDRLELTRVLFAIAEFLAIF